MKTRLTAFSCIAIVFLVLSSPLQAGHLTPEQKQEKAVAAGDYLCATMNSDGSFLYEYNASECTKSVGYDWARHCQTTLALTRLYQATGHEKYLQAAQKAAKATLSGVSQLTVDGSKYKILVAAPVEGLPDNAIVKTSDVAMAGVSLLHLDKVRGSLDFKNQVQNLCQYLLGVQAPEGSLECLHVADEDMEAGVQLLSTACQGQALLALSMAQAQYPDPERLRAVHQLANYLVMDWAYQESKGHQEGFDHWGLIGLTKAYHLLDDDLLARVHQEYTQTLGSQKSHLQDQLENKPLFQQRKALKASLSRCDRKISLAEKHGALTKKNLIPLAFGYCNSELKGQILDPGSNMHGSFWEAKDNLAECASRLEGLEAFYTLVISIPNTRYQGWINRWEPRLNLTRTFVSQCQYSKDDSLGFNCPVDVTGAFRRNETKTFPAIVRADYLQHGIFSLLGWEGL